MFILECLDRMKQNRQNRILLNQSMQSAACDCRSRGLEFELQPGHQTFLEVEHETISTAILPLMLIQEELLSVTCTAKVCALKLVNHFRRSKPAQEQCEWVN